MISSNRSMPRGVVRTESLRVGKRNDSAQNGFFSRLKRRINGKRYGKYDFGPSDVFKDENNRASWRVDDNVADMLNRQIHAELIGAESRDKTDNTNVPDVMKEAQDGENEIQRKPCEKITYLSDVSVRLNADDDFSSEKSRKSKKFSFAKMRPKDKKKVKIDHRKIQNGNYKEQVVIIGNRPFIESEINKETSNNNVSNDIPPEDDSIGMDERDKQEEFVVRHVSCSSQIFETPVSLPTDFDLENGYVIRDDNAIDLDEESETKSMDLFDDIDPYATTSRIKLAGTYNVVEDNRERADDGVDEKCLVERSTSKMSEDPGYETLERLQQEMLEFGVQGSDPVPDHQVVSGGSDNVSDDCMVSPEVVFSSRGNDSKTSDLGSSSSTNGMFLFLSGHSEYASLETDNVFIVSRVRNSTSPKDGEIIEEDIYANHMVPQRKREQSLGENEKLVFDDETNDSSLLNNKAFGSFLCALDVDKPPPPLPARNYSIEDVENERMEHRRSYRHRNVDRNDPAGRSPTGYKHIISNETFSELEQRKLDDKCRVERNNYGKLQPVLVNSECLPSESDNLREGDSNEGTMTQYSDNELYEESPNELEKRGAESKITTDYSVDDISERIHNSGGFRVIDKQSTTGRQSRQQSRSKLKVDHKHICTDLDNMERDGYESFDVFLTGFNGCPGSREASDGKVSGVDASCSSTIKPDGTNDSLSKTVVNSEANENASLALDQNPTGDELYYENVMDKLAIETETVVSGGTPRGEASSDDYFDEPIHCSLRDILAARPIDCDDDYYYNIEAIKKAESETRGDNSLETSGNSTGCVGCPRNPRGDVGERALTARSSYVCLCNSEPIHMSIAELLIIETSSHRRLNCCHDEQGREAGAAAEGCGLDGCAVSGRRTTDDLCDDVDVTVEEHCKDTEDVYHVYRDGMKQLKDCGWYWGPLSIAEAETKLCKKPDGAFLVRDSHNENYILSLSFKSEARIHHMRIEHNKGNFAFWSQPESHGRSTIKEFIDQVMVNSRTEHFRYFHRAKVPGTPPVPIYLLYPVSRFLQVSSLQHLCRFVILENVRRDHINDLPVPRGVQAYLKQTQYYAENIDEDTDDVIMADDVAK